MEIRSTDETMEKVFEFAEKLIGLQLQKKGIDSEIKDLKNDYKEEGIATSLVTKIVNKMKAEMKKTPGELLEEDILTEKMEANNNLKDMVSSLND
jgi:uncharacterized protein (UPF0335 family)